MLSNSGPFLTRKFPNLAKLIIHLAPLRAFRRSHRIAREEARKIRQFIVGGGKSFRLVFSEANCYPGLGDFLTTVALSRFLEDAGWNCQFVLEPDKDGQAELSDEKAIVTSLYGPRKFASPDGEVHTIFQDSLDLGVDITGPTLALISMLYEDRTINPQRLKPTIFDNQAFSNSQSNLNNRFIALHVRSSAHDLNRNPPLHLVIQDISAILATFPGMHMRWFGEREKFNHVLSLLPEELQGRISFQRSSSFHEVGDELLNCMFWFQRSGGGVGVYALFSQIPYLILSADVAASRLYRRKGGSLVPWAMESQQYHLQVLRTDRKVGSILKSKVWSKFVWEGMHK